MAMNVVYYGVCVLERWRQCDDGCDSKMNNIKLKKIEEFSNLRERDVLWYQDDDDDIAKSVRRF